jgi:hypothetical protein
MAQAIEEGRRRGPAESADKGDQAEKTEKKKKERAPKGKEVALSA